MDEEFISIELVFNRGLPDETRITDTGAGIGNDDDRSLGKVKEKH